MIAASLLAAWLLIFGGSDTREPEPLSDGDALVVLLDDCHQLADERLEYFCIIDVSEAVFAP